jgi:hypothetical protein
MMQRQQCKMQKFLCQGSLSLGQLRLVPKVGQWGQLNVRVFNYK